MFIYEETFHTVLLKITQMYKTNKIGEIHLGDISPQQGCELALVSLMEGYSEPTWAGPVQSMSSKQMDTEGSHSDHTCGAKQRKFRALCFKSKNRRTQSLAQV